MKALFLIALAVLTVSCASRPPGRPDRPTAAPDAVLDVTLIPRRGSFTVIETTTLPRTSTRAIPYSTTRIRRVSISRP